MKTVLTLIVLLSAFFYQPLHASDGSQVQFRYNVYSNDLNRYRGQKLTLELHLCDENGEQCLPVGKSEPTAAPPQAKAFKLQCQVNIAQKTLESVLSRLKTNAERAKLIFEVRANGQEEGKLSFQLGGPLKRYLELARLGGSQRYMAGAAADTGLIEFTEFEAQLVQAPSKNPIAPPGAGARPSVK